MKDAISVELQFFLISILCGAILLIVYDVLRIFRRLLKHDAFFIALEDLIFWVLASLFIFAMLFKENNGIIRGFAVMGMAIGMVLYHFMISDMIVNLITKLIQTLISPFVFVLKKIKGFVGLVFKQEKRVFNFMIRRLKKWTKSVRIELNKRKQAVTAKREKRSNERLRKKQKENEIKQAKKQAAKKSGRKQADQKTDKKTDKDNQQTVSQADKQKVMLVRSGRVSSIKQIK